MKYAVIRLGGQQFNVKEGDTLETTALGKPVYDVLLFKDGEVTLVGEPFVKTVEVQLDHLEDKRQKKVVVARFKSKSRYKKTKGHKQPVSVYKVVAITMKKKEREVKK